MDDRAYKCGIKVGCRVPEFKVKALMPDQSFKEVSLEENMKAGKWTIVFLWPQDFSFICPTEIVAYSKHYDDFQAENAEIFGVSTDPVHSHLAWTQIDVKDGGIGHIKFPLIGDDNRKISELFGVLDETKGVSLRGLFIISPKGILEHQTVNNLNVGRSTEETLRVLSALKSDGLCPANWKKGEATLPKK